MAKVGFTTKDGTVVSFTTKKRSTRKNESTAIAVRANKRKPAKRKPAARKPVKRTAVSRSSKDKATFKFYVVFRGPPKGLNIHAGFATQQAARAYITKKFKGTRRLQVRGRPGLVKSGHNPKVAANWKTFSLAASLKAAPAPRRRKTTTRRNSGKFEGFTDYEAERTLATSAHVGKDARRRAARREREAQELALLEAERDVREADRRRKKGLTRKIKPVYSREYLEAKGMPRRNPAAKKIASVQYTATCPVHGTRNAPWPQFGEMGFGHYGATVCWACREREDAERKERRRALYGVDRNEEWTRGSGLPDEGWDF